LTCLVLQSSTVSAGTVLHQHPIAAHCQAPQAARVYPNEFTSIKEGDTMVIAEGSAPNFVAHFVPFINLTPSVNQNLSSSPRARGCTGSPSPRASALGGATGSLDSGLYLLRGYVAQRPRRQPRRGWPETSARGSTGGGQHGCGLAKPRPLAHPAGVSCLSTRIATVWPHGRSPVGLELGNGALRHRPRTPLRKSLPDSA